MRILIINRFYWPDESATSLLATDLAQDLAERGHETHVLCARILYENLKQKLPPFEEYNRVRIHRAFSTRLGRSSEWRRLLDLISFHFGLRWTGPFTCKPDVIFVMTDPPMVLSAARWIQRFRGGKIVHHVDDLYPDIAVALNALRPDGFTTRWLSNRNSKWLQKCVRVLALGERMKEHLLTKGVLKNRIVVTPPWADGERIKPVVRSENAFRAELNLGESDVLVMYSGNMGQGHSFEAILSGIEKLQGQEHLHFVFIGGGAKKIQIEQLIEEKQLNRVKLLPYQPRTRLAETLSAADIHLIAQDPRTVGLIVPSKTAGIFAAGRPAIFVGPKEAEIAESITSNQCGFVVDIGDAVGFVSAVNKMTQKQAEREQMGKNARAAFEKYYSRKIVVEKIIKTMEHAHSEKQ